MIKLISRWALLAYIWKKYSFAIQFVCVWVFLSAFITLLHSEYISYCIVSGDTCNTGLSYMLKWGGILGIGIITFAILRFRASRELPESQTDLSDSDLDRTPVSDGFDSIRGKTTLLSRGDLIIQRKPGR